MIPAERSGWVRRTASGRHSATVHVIADQRGIAAGELEHPHLDEQAADAGGGRHDGRRHVDTDPVRVPGGAQT